MSSESQILITTIEDISVHPNADTLEIASVFGNPVIVRKGDYTVGQKVAYVPVDMLVPVTLPEFAFLKERSVNAEGYHRVRAIKLRQAFSMGLVFIPSNYDIFASRDVGMDITDVMGAKKYEPNIAGINGPYLGGDDEAEPDYFRHYTDIEPLRRYKNVIQPDEEVVCLEKVHGCNARYLYRDGRLWVGSRTRAKKEAESNLWWRAAKQYDLESKLAMSPGITFYAELYGQVQDLKYGHAAGEISLVFYDAVLQPSVEAFDYDRFLNEMDKLQLPVVPELYRGRYADIPADLAEGMTVIGNAAHIREGYVVKPVKERNEWGIGRIVFKMVGEGYHLRKEKA